MTQEEWLERIKGTIEMVKQEQAEIWSKGEESEFHAQILASLERAAEHAREYIEAEAARKISG